MADALEDHEGSVSTGGRAIAGLRFADDIDGCSRRGRTAKIVEPLDKASTAYSIEISAEKTVLMPLVLFVNSLVFSALISMPSAVEALSRRST